MRITFEFNKNEEHLLKWSLRKLMLIVPFRACGNIEKGILYEEKRIISNVVPLEIPEEFWKRTGYYDYNKNKPSLFPQPCEHKEWIGYEENNVRCKKCGKRKSELRQDQKTHSD